MPSFSPRNGEVILKDTKRAIEALCTFRVSVPAMGK